MNDTPNFMDILDKPADSIEAPKPLAVGTYLGIISAPHSEKEVGANKTKFVSWPVKLIQPQSDVDVAALNESLTSKDGTVKSLSEVKMNYDMALTDNSAHIVLDWLENTLGIDKSGKTMRQMLAETVGKQMLVTVKHGMTKGNNPRVFASIDSTAKV